MLNRQKKRKAALTLTDKINIAYKVLIEYDKILDVAKEFRFTKAGVSGIVSKIQKNKAAFDECYRKETTSKLRGGRYNERYLP